MRFRFNERKTVQAAAFILNRHGGSLNYMVLIKLLYLADRKALIERGLPITGDRMVSMDQGPVLSMVLDLINWGKRNQPSPWFDYISPPDAYSVSLICAEPEDDELSRYELSILEDIDERFGKMDKWDLVDYMHDLPEWDDPHGSSIPIPPVRVLREADVSDEVIQAISQEAEESWFFRAALSAR